MLGGPRTLVAAATTVVCLALAAAAQAAPGDLDTSFGQGGMATVDLHHNAFGNALVVQPDGKPIVAGTAISANGATTDVVAARFTLQGAADSSYGGQGAGVAQPDFGGNETGYGAALQSDGKLVIAGDSTDSTGKTHLLVARFNGDGSADTNFGGQGTGFALPAFELNFDGAQTFGRAMALQPDGQIVVVGYATIGNDIHPLLARVNNPGGTADTNFGDGGALVTADAEDQLSAVTVESNTKLEAAGEHNSALGQPGDFFVDGFGGGNPIFAPIDLGGDDVATATAVQPDGKVLVAGYTNAKGTYDFVVMRLNADHSPDTSFGTAGKAIVDLGGSDTAKAMVLQSDGKIVVAGTTTSASTSQIGVVRLLANGQPDSGFGHNGVSVVGFGAAKLAGNAMGLEPNGDIVVGGTITPAGSTQKNLLVVRLHGDANPSSGTGGGSGGSGGGSTGGQAGAPTLSGLSVSKKTFRQAGFLPKLNPTGPTKGTLVSVSVSATAQLTLTFSQAAPGRLANGHCAAPSKRNREKRHCTRQLQRGSITLQAASGVNKVAFGGRLTPTKKLTPGSYTVAITATAGGATSAPMTVTITVKR